jgi:hypothetical protein
MTVGVRFTSLGWWSLDFPSFFSALPIIGDSSTNEFTRCKNNQNFFSNHCSYITNSLFTVSTDNEHVHLVFVTVHANKQLAFSTVTID